MTALSFSPLYTLSPAPSTYVHAVTADISLHIQPQPSPPPSPSCLIQISVTWAGPCRLETFKYHTCTKRWCPQTCLKLLPHIVAVISIKNSLSSTGFYHIYLLILFSQTLSLVTILVATPRRTSLLSQLHTGTTINYNDQLCPILLSAMSKIQLCANNIFTNPLGRTALQMSPTCKETSTQL